MGCGASATGVEAVAADDRHDPVTPPAPTSASSKAEAPPSTKADTVPAGGRNADQGEETPAQQVLSIKSINSGSTVQSPCSGAHEVLASWMLRHGNEVQHRYEQESARRSQVFRVDPPAETPKDVLMAIEPDGGKHVVKLIQGLGIDAWTEALQPMVEWVVGAAAAAPYYPETKQQERKLLGNKMFVTNLTPDNFDSLRQQLKERMLEMGTKLKSLPSDAQGVNLGFSIQRLVQPGRPKRAMQGNEGILPTPPGVNWRDPVALNERAYIHMLNLVAIAINDGFQARVRSTLKTVFGASFTGHTPAPTKTYARMVGKLISKEDHRYEEILPRPMLNVDVVRSAVNVKTTYDIEAALAALAREFGGFVKEKNKYLYPEDDLQREFYLRLILVSMIHEDERTFGQLIEDPEVQAKWQEFEKPENAALESVSKSRRKRSLARAKEWLSRPEIAHMKVRMICEVQVMTDETLHIRHGMHELFKVFRAPDKYSLFRDMDKAQKVIKGLGWAARYGELDDVAYFLEKKADVNEGREGDPVPLFLAAESGHPDVVDHLLKEGANVNWTDPDSMSSSLYMASQNGHTEVVEVLVRYQPDLEMVDNLGVTPLHVAVLHGYKDIVHVLILARADVNKQTGFLSTPLHNAAQEGYPDIIRQLIQAKSNMEARDEEGCTPLWVACTGGHKSSAAALLEAGADPDSSDDSNQRPLNQAVLLGHRDIVELLISWKADVNASGQDGTPLEDAGCADLGQTSQAWMAKVLREAGAKET
mmetsp:Transcript_10817/g.24743  ORF Transcript_10817/g.24743 Transcript_10817/m.24743 type:complete len:761 (+) Transcript_10817:38-2320(+)